MNTLDVVLHTHQPITSDQIADLQAQGLHLVSAVGTNAYRFRGTTATTVADLQALASVASAEEFMPMEKLDLALQSQVGQVAAAAVAAVAAFGPIEAPQVSVLVSLDRNADVNATLAELGQLGTIKESTTRRALVEVAADQLEALVAIPGVLAAEVEPEVKTQNNVARMLTGANPVATTLGLDGNGEIVGVADSGLDNGNAGAILADFAGRVVNLRATVSKAAFGVPDAADLNNHGTHVSGSILGAGANSNGNLRGLAPAARLTLLSMGPNNTTSLSVPIDLTSGVFQDAYADGARLHNNSWGANSSFGGYTSYSRDVDRFVRDHRDMLILIAAGNSGSGASTVTPPGTAKNCLTVGASESVRSLPATATLSSNLQDNDSNPATPNVNVPLQLTNFSTQADSADHIASFSGRGPTVDNRIKPEIVAPGTWILSTRSRVSTADVGPDGLLHVGNITTFYANDADGVATHDEAVGRGLPGAGIFGTWDQNTPDAPAGSGPNYQQNYFYDSGTSMATPITTGAVALLRQYLRQRRGVANPSAALMKALLVNGATVPAGQTNAPDNDRGFGWLNLENTLTPAPTGQQTYSDDVQLAVATNDVRTFSVQLAQIGHPFRVTLVWNDEPGSGLQNKLYLRVIDPAGTIFDGDVTVFPAARNNVQRVHIATPIAGTYTVEVHGIEVLFGIDDFPGQSRQDFALAIINGIGFSPKVVDVCQVIDKSGSMGFYGYMDPVKERAKQFVDMLRINDRTGAVAFDGAASLVHPLVHITGLSTQAAIKLAIDGLGAGGVTSIGGGLQLGQAQLAAGGDPMHPQALVLLSDGHENTPPWVGGGVTDSPPGWYGGPDFTEVLPTLPAGTKVYTVSLGVQSDEVLLQEIANQTGGIFHAIYSPAEIAKLHEIYVHLQALTGGEEVIASGSDDVAGTRSAAGLADVAVFAKGPIDALQTDLMSLSQIDAADLHLLQRVPTSKLHTVPVDESVGSLTLMISWHDPKAPASLSIISPSQKTYALGDPSVFNVAGTSYQFYRIETPEPGVWTMVVTSGKGDARVSSYTWGAYGTTPLGIRCELPKKLAGLGKLDLSATLVGESDLVRTVRFSGLATRPSQSVTDLLDRHGDALKKIDLPFDLDTPKLDPSLFKLGLLDQQLAKDGKGSIFQTQTRRLRLTRNNQYTAGLALPVTGIYTVQIAVAGQTRTGQPFQREVRRSIRN